MLQVLPKKGCHSSATACHRTAAALLVGQSRTLLNEVAVENAVGLRLQIPSDNVPFNELPDMKAAEITAAGKEALMSKKFDMVRINYANPDMVRCPCNTSIPRVMMMMNQSGPHHLRQLRHSECSVVQTKRMEW